MPFRKVDPGEEIKKAIKNNPELLKEMDRAEKECPCMREKSLNCGMKCSRCGREL